MPSLLESASVWQLSSSFPRVGARALQQNEWLFKGGEGQMGVKQPVTPPFYPRMRTPLPLDFIVRRSLRLLLQDWKTLFVSLSSLQVTCIVFHAVRARRFSSLYCVRMLAVDSYYFIAVVGLAFVSIYLFHGPSRKVSRKV